MVTKTKQINALAFFVTIAVLILFALSISQTSAQVVLPPPGLDVETTDGFGMSGAAFPGSTVVLTTSESNASCTVRADSSGRFEGCTLHKSGTDGETIIGIVQDTQGNTSEPVRVGTIRVAPDAERGFLREGLFGCAAGEYALPTGTLTAIGGIYVPVNDAAVTLNTGYLVYKECVLDGVIVAMREAATAALVKSSLNYINTGGENGEPLFPQNIENYVEKHLDETAFEFLKEHTIGNICAPFKQQVKVTLAKEYLRAKSPQSSFACNIGLSEESHKAVLSGNSFEGGWNTFFKLVSDKGSNPLSVGQAAKQELAIDLAQKETERLTLLSYGNGLISPEQIDQLPTDTDDTRLSRTILTPGFLIARQLEQVAGSGFRQTENANEVDQIINALFSGIGNQILTSVRGLTGISESNRGKAPYLDQLSSESSARVRQSASNAALAALNSTLTTETGYNSIKKEIDAFIDKAMADIIATERRCWDLIEPAVAKIAFECVESEDISVTDPNTGVTSTEIRCLREEPIPYEVSTSTQFSTAAIDPEIRPLSNIMKEDVRSSNNALVLLGRLINDVRNTASQTIQRVALEKLDALIGNRAIHTAFDVKSVQEQKPNVESTVGALVEDTITAWGTGSGWCNVENSSVVRGWLNAWRTDGK
jgi:hypothetical protein